MQQVHLLHIGKTGGSAIKWALKPYLKSKPPVVVLHGHPTTLESLQRGVKVTFFLRDPITRFVSGFYSRQRQSRPRYNRTWTPAEAQAFDAFNHPNELALALSSESRSQSLQAQKAMKSIRHVQRSYWKWFKNRTYFLSRHEDIFFYWLSGAPDRRLRIFLPKAGARSAPETAGR